MSETKRWRSSLPQQHRHHLVLQVDAWAVSHDHLTEMQQQWQSLEAALFERAKKRRVSCERACASDWPEARAMRDLRTSISALFHALEISADEILRMDSATIADAIAKIRLGLLVQGPFDWRENALELMRAGLEDLRHLTEKADGRS